MDTTVQDIFLCVKHKIPAMLAAAGGAILNGFSLAGPMGFRDRRVYSASKDAVARLTSSTALEVARCGVRVNAARPAGIEEAMNHRPPLPATHALRQLSSAAETPRTVPEIKPRQRVSERFRPLRTPSVCCRRS
jgi:NAD(P)-dependent dehydrogenase (short-subunit alcohol dehydrogenase family)